MVCVGHPDHGTAVVISQSAVDVWRDRNVVSAQMLL